MPNLSKTDDLSQQQKRFRVLMTLDLTAFMSDRDSSIQTRLINDFPFPQRSDGKMLMFATPVHMQATCIACHNSHIDSPKRDWKVGDVRGVQVVTLPASKNVWVQSSRFFYLLSFVFIAFITALLALFIMDRRVRKTVGLLFDRNQKLEEASKELKQQQNALDQHAIVSMTELALDTQLTATQRGYLGVVRSSADALLSILNDILDFSKIDAGKLEITPIDTDIKSLISQCLKPAALLARKKGIALVVEIMMVEQLGYSAQTFDSAEVLLRTVKERTNREKDIECPPLFFIHHQLSEDSNGIKVIKDLIRDGISVDQCVLISDASGDLLNSDLQLLGLTRVITYPPTPIEIAEMLHPKGDTDIAPVVDNKEPILNILLVEDNTVNQRLISTLLLKRQHAVTLAENGQEAIDLCKHELFDLILMDMQMPVMGGVLE